MDESVKSGARLEVSVSFGRFENDALAWEKWSSFSPNKYLEEVGTLSTPGSVAQKKAYFEAHYKKIAAKKAEEMGQEKLMDHVNPGADISSKEDCVENSSEIDAKFGSSDGERLVEVAQEDCVAVSTNEAIMDEAKDDNVRSSKGDEEEAIMNGLMDAVDLEEEKVDAAVPVKSEASAIEDTKDELNIRKDSSSVESETPQKDSQRITQKPQERKNGKEQSTLLKRENPKSNARSITQKVTPIKKERNSDVTKKKVVSPAVKPLQASTPRYSKPISTSTPMFTSQVLKKKANGSPLLKSKNSLTGESKSAAPTSLHMSLSLGPANALGDFSTTRKSLIMEKMGDKDIVKRAFKTFQNRTNGSISDEKPSTVKNVSSTAFEPKMSAFRTPTKGNEGLRKDAEKRTTPRSQSGTRSNPLPSRSHKSFALDKKNTTTFSPTTASRSDEKAEKRKEFLKKLEAKSIAREAENAKLSAKSKVGVDNENHRKA
ncbi:hypothetical protein CDL12_09301 [Handroanthus impetiginosus]|uniref:TPX2 C-terminal domain-containing protein n=1 Tax=Handroanthus impetiginosus TaxID=429701 RepID=A0A2G9HKJ8_9LAMI|nr:hypothetical protein CDL12_09301 [Handroanthus impetiginosus]